MMKSLILAAALVALPSLAFAQAAAPAPAAPAAPEAAPAAPAATTDVYDMSCKAFHHNADGSWNAVQPMTLQPAAGPIALKPSFKFKPGTLFAGFDLATELDKACPH